ncbi:MAG: sporulation protein YqfD [Firmicutes bacterium]|nr:sporulation protein YqfD [Bacillota bacterium]
MFKKFFKFLYGYVIIKVYGKGAERFLNICLRRGISVWNTAPIENGIEMCVAKRDFFLLRRVAGKCRVRVRIAEKRGLSRLIGLYRHRYALIIGAAVCVAFLAALSQFIWVVEINGAENSDINSITATLDRLGIKSGALKRNIPEGMEIKREILNDTDQIAWAWVYIEGAKARVEIYEKIIPPSVTDKSTPCDIVAACDGVIKRMVVKNGEEIFKTGDAVSSGDVIVSGKVSAYKEGEKEKYIYVHSMADVEAYTSHTRTGDYKLYYESRTPTGKHRTHYSVEILGKLFSLPFKDIAYEEYDVKESRRELSIPFFGYTGIALAAVRYDEVNVNREPLSIETAVEFAKNDLEEKISKELTQGSVLTDENVEYVQKNNETITVTLKMDFIQNIAVQQPLDTEENKGEEIFDKQTDRGAAGG